jgi:hypothetical protein
LTVGFGITWRRFIENKQKNNKTDHADEWKSRVVYERGVINTQQDHGAVYEARADDCHVVQLWAGEFDVPEKKKK